MIPQRIRDYDLIPGLLTTGPKNLISDVDGVRVGHYTLRRNPDIRTGITVIDPSTANIFRRKLPAAVAVGNGFGKLVGYTQIEELGAIETPIALTNTLAVGPVARGLIDITLAATPDIDPMETINPVVGETNDGILNRIHSPSIASNDVQAAYDARSTTFELGCVGAGTGTRAFSWKGGIGSASRLVELDDHVYTLGVLTQTNFGGALTIMGVPIGQKLGQTDYDSEFVRQFLQKPDGSCMIVVATDAPLDARQLKRLAKRALLGMARTGSVMANGSGDYAIAFSTQTTPGGISDDRITPFFLAAVETTEESIYDALFTATTTTGRAGNTLARLPVDDVVAMIRARL